MAKKGIKIGTHISKCAGIEDTAFSDYETEIDALNNELNSLGIFAGKQKKILKKCVPILTDGSTIILTATRTDNFCNLFPIIHEI